MTPVMTRSRPNEGQFLPVLLLALAFLPGAARAQESISKTRLQIYGFVMTDMGYLAGQVHPDWYDVLRPTKLAAFENEFGEDGRFFAGVRQTRIGVKSFTPTDLGELKTTIEFDLFGLGVDAGQTTLRPRVVYGELGRFGAGKIDSPFMDIDVCPNMIEYWGPSGMVFFRNVLIRWMPIQGDTRMTFAIERPGASGDVGDYASYYAVTDSIVGRFSIPDVSGEFRLGRPWGYFEVAGIFRYTKWDYIGHLDYDFSGEEIGWGVNLSSNVKIRKDTIRLQAAYGEGVENYMNDATVDIGLRPNPGNPRTPVEAETLPVLGIVAFYDRVWSGRWTSTAGYSLIDIENTEGQRDDAFSRGHYALVNLLCYPAPGLMLGPEFEWGRRENYNDGWTVDDFRFQFSLRYDFSVQMGDG